jgi:hypothetical protein
VNGVLKGAWALTGFVIIAGVVLWATTGRTVFAVFIGLGVLTAVGAWLTGRAEASAARQAAAREPAAPNTAPTEAAPDPAVAKEETP